MYYLVVARLTLGQRQRLCRAARKASAELLLCGAGPRKDSIYSDQSPSRAASIRSARNLATLHPPAQREQAPGQVKEAFFSGDF